MELIYDFFAVKANDKWVAKELVRKLGHPNQISASKDVIDEILHLDREWSCWTLSEGDIRTVARRMKIDNNKLSDDNIAEIARKFKRALEFNAEDWTDWLKESINETIEENN